MAWIVTRTTIHRQLIYWDRRKNRTFSRMGSLSRQYRDSDEWKSNHHMRDGIRPPLAQSRPSRPFANDMLSPSSQEHYDTIRPDHCHLPSPLLSQVGIPGKHAQLPGVTRIIDDGQTEKMDAGRQRLEAADRGGHEWEKRRSDSTHTMRNQAAQ